MNKKILALFFVILLVPFVLSQIYINEVELNPPGIIDHEWVELYNNGASVNLSNWYIEDRDHNKFFFPDAVIDDFYVLEEFSNDLVNSNENISLFNNFEVFQDQTLLLSDSQGNDKTWQKVPDGTGSFVFQEGTKGFSNAPTTIENETTDKSCIVESENVTLIAQISGFCIEEAIFNVDNSENFTGTKLGNNYTYKIPAFSLNQGWTDWKVYAKDCFNRTKMGNAQSFFVKDGSSLSISPSSPNGNNGWYITEPELSLDEGNADKVWYQWDRSSIKMYTGWSFGLEGIPNGAGLTGIESAGILELKWFSDVCASELGRNETSQNKILKVDLVNPVIKNVFPAENSVAVSSIIDVSAYIDEVYNGNSGVNLSRIIMKIDGKIVNASVKNQDSIDAKVNYTTNLNLGNHTASVYAEDNAGRSSFKEWIFQVDVAPDFFINVSSPDSNIYEKKNILFNLSIVDNESNSVEVEKVKYINNNDNRPRWATLCMNCNGYERKRNLNEGQNNITIKASLKGISKEIYLFIFVDSKKPRISSILPKKKSITNGSDFYIRYSEENLNEIELFWNNKSKVLNCSSGEKQECGTFVNLSEYDGGSILYWFSVSDSINTMITKPVNISVDTTSPILTINMPKNGTYGKKVPFNISVSEKVKIEYIDLWAENPEFKKICGNCDEYGLNRIKTPLFNKGIHELKIRATDKAGNSDEGNIGFFVDY